MRRFLLFLLVLILAGCTRVEPNSSLIRPGDRIPAFQVEMEDGSFLSSGGLIGSPCFIIFFNTTCSDCQKTLPEVQKAYELYGETIRFVAISHGQAASDVRSWWDENGITLPFAAQEDSAVYHLFATSHIPRVYICNSKGVVVTCFDDDPCPTFADLEQALKGL